MTLVKKHGIVTIQQMILIILTYFMIAINPDMFLDLLIGRLLVMPGSFLRHLANRTIIAI